MGYNENDPQNGAEISRQLDLLQQTDEQLQHTAREILNNIKTMNGGRSIFVDYPSSTTEGLVLGTIESLHLFVQGAIVEYVRRVEGAATGGRVLVQDQLVALFYALTEAQDSLEKLYRIYGARFDSVSSTGESPLRARKDSVVTQRKKNASELYFEQGAKEPRKFVQTFAAQYDGINKSINTQLKLLANHVQTELKAENQVIERDSVEWFGDILLGEAIWRAAERAQNELGNAPQKLKTIAPNSLEGVLKGYSAYRNAKGMNFFPLEKISATSATDTTIVV